jgi:putative ATP-dependent endonuclease of OLD family
MSIQIDAIRIAGLRGIQNIEASLPRITVLIGPNNSGKTSFLKAMQLVLGDYSRFVSEEDFNIGDGDTRATSIIVDVRIVPVKNDGSRAEAFNDEWATEFGDKIKAEPNLSQFVALRARCQPNLIKGGFDTSRFTLEKWPNFNTWSTEEVKETRMTQRLNCIPFYAIDAQRDIHSELKERSSYIGRVLSNVDYSKSDIDSIEGLIKAANEEAVDKSTDLKELKGNIEKLNQSFQGIGDAEITPFPKKIRDLSKHFTVHFGSGPEGTFSMEYHVMGTRSWASLLTVKALVKLTDDRYRKEAEPFFAIVAAEEPEAHLHPNAQRTLYRQLSETNGQVIVSTHSPYLCAMSDISNIRSLSKKSGSVEIRSMACPMTAEDKNILAREIMSKRGELLFSSALILCEGITEEQVIPGMFQIAYGRQLHEAGVACVSVGGKNYAPFVKLACSLGIPTFIVSDNDGNTYNEIEAQLRRLKRDTGLALSSDEFAIEYLSSGNDFESELLALGLRDELVYALVLSETKGSGNKRYIAAKHREIAALTDPDLLSRLRASKASYAGFLGDVIRSNPNRRTKETLVPLSVRNGFTIIEGWLIQ